MSRLDNYDIAILLDRSGSMGIEDCPNGKTRWAYARENVEAIATRTARMDKDGIDTALLITVRDSRILSLPYLPFRFCPRWISKTLYT
jgi:hypothetical protein